MKAYISKEMVFKYTNNPPGMQNILKTREDLKRSELFQDVIPIELNHHSGIIVGSATNLAWDAERNQPMVDVDWDDTLIRKHAPHLLDKEEIAVSPLYKYDFLYQEGEFNGEKHDGLAKNIKWKNLAIIESPNQRARCGIQDGCKLKISKNGAGKMGSAKGIISIDAIILDNELTDSEIKKDDVNMPDDKLVETLKAEYDNRVAEKDTKITQYKEQIEKYQQAERLNLVQQVSKYKIKDDVLKDKSSDFLKGILHGIDWIKSDDFKKLVQEGAADALEVEFEKITPKPPSAPAKGHSYVYKPVPPKAIDGGKA